MRRKATVWLGVCGVGVAALIAPRLARAAVITVPGDAGDYDIKQNSAGDPVLETSTATTAAVGAKASNRGYNAIFIFELPVLPAGEGVSTANFAVAPTVSQGPGDAGHFGVDLWGIGFQADTTPLIEYLEANSDPDLSNIKLQDSFMTTANTYPNNTKVNTGAAGDAALATYLQSFYNLNPSYAGGTYVFLRLNPDINPDDFANINSGFSFATANQGTSSIRPELTIETSVLPEPASLALMGLGSLLIGVPRRR